MAPKESYEDDKHFGFIPIYDHSGFKGLPRPDCSAGVYSIEQYIQLCNIVENSGLPNYLGVRAPVPSKFNIGKCQQLLRGYWDTQLLQILAFDFPLSLHTRTNAVVNNINHPSAMQFKSFVRDYLYKEVEQGAILGPFSEPPFDNLHTSPLMTRPKDVTGRRIIVDLSWGDPNSVNACSTEYYQGLEYVLKYPTIDIIVQRVRQLGPRAQIFKVDIERAFRNMPIDPRDARFLGLYWDGAYWIDRSIPFGFLHGSSCCQRVTDAVRYVVNSKGGNIFNYCDDFIGVDLPGDATRNFRILEQTLQDMGLPNNVKKRVEPTSVAICLGLCIDIIHGTVSIPDDKLLEIHTICNKFANYKTVTKVMFQSLLGKLLYVSRCIKSSRLFLGRMLQLLRDSHDSKRVKLTQDFHKDLAWFRAFLYTFNGVSYIDRPSSYHIYVDASPYGFGAIFNDQVYAVPYVEGFIPNASIVHLEMYNIFLALGVWASHWKNASITINCDNQAVVAALTNLRIKDSLLMLIARNIWLLAAQFDIELNVIYVNTKHNIYADILSRWFTAATFDKKYIDYLRGACGLTFHIICFILIIIFNRR